jgi:hypothetical protein
MKDIRLALKADNIKLTQRQIYYELYRLYPDKDTYMWKFDLKEFRIVMRALRKKIKILIILIIGVKRRGTIYEEFNKLVK